MMKQSDISTLKVDYLRTAIEEELSALREIDTRYAKMRAKLDGWTGSQTEKEGLLQRIEDGHRRHREPHVLRLAELHQKMTSSPVFEDRSAN
jgi:hypothetical protein